MMRIRFFWPGTLIFIDLFCIVLWIWSEFFKFYFEWIKISFFVFVFPVLLWHNSHPRKQQRHSIQIFFAIVLTRWRVKIETRKSLNFTSSFLGCRENLECRFFFSPLLKYRLKREEKKQVTCFQKIGALIRDKTWAQRTCEPCERLINLMIALVTTSRGKWTVH